MTRVIGLDYGDKNIGVAVSDPTGLLAQGLVTLRRDDPHAYKKLVSEIKKLVLEYNAGLVILGYPKNMDNSEGERCKKTLLFRERLEKALGGVRVELCDERLSTLGAARALDEAGLSQAKKKEVIDKMAAVFILQGYLDYQNNHK